MPNFVGLNGKNKSDGAVAGSNNDTEKNHHQVEKVNMMTYFVGWGYLLTYSKGYFTIRVFEVEPVFRGLLSDPFSMVK